MLVARGLAIRSEKCFKDVFCSKLLFCSSPNEILLLHTFILEWKEQQWSRDGVCLSRHLKNKAFEKLKLAGEMRSGPLAFGEEVAFSKTGTCIRVILLRLWLTFALVQAKIVVNRCVPP